jgi:DNA-binding winged helix-turn-helix (wHTH) protein/tetratricopeptide (TPR) repeat protein
MMKEFPPFRLDTVNQCLWRRGDAEKDEAIQLTPKAFLVLRYLVEHAARLVTQDELLDAVWPDVHVDPAVLKNQILNIRNALGDRPAHPVFIQTLARRGYRFVAPVREGGADTNLESGSLSRSLVGRQAAFGALRDALGKALKGQRQIVFLTGEMGIGKTALAGEFQRRAAADVPGIRIVRKEAYYPMLEALDQLGQGSSQTPAWLAKFPALMKLEHREVLQREILGATRERILRDIGEALEAIASTTPLLLVFEDLHWVDPSTIDLISALARRRGPAKLMVLGTYRPADVEASSHPLKALTEDLLVRGWCREIALEPLAEAEITKYLMGGGSETASAETLAALLYRRSEGNPLLMVAAVEHLSERGLIFRKHGGWRSKGALGEVDLGVPENLRRMIEDRIERLSAEEQRVLEVASLHSIGRSRFGVAPRAAVIDLEPQAFQDVCETLSRRHRIVRLAAPKKFPDGTVTACYEFVHALYRDVCYRRMSPCRRVKLHKRLGEVMEARLLDHAHESAPWLASHFEQGEDWPRAIQYLKLAADTARRGHSMGEAIATLEHAARLVSRLPEKDRVCCEVEILEQLAVCYVALCDGRPAIETYEKLVTLAERFGLIDVEIRALLAMAIPAAWISDQLEIETAERALLLSGRRKDPLERAKIRATCFAWRAMAGRWRPEDAERCRKAIEQIERQGDGQVLAEHRLRYAQIQSRSSRYGEAHRNAIDSLAILFGQDDPTAHFGDLYPMDHYRKQHWLVIRNLLLWGEWGQALKKIPAAIALLEKNGDDAAGKEIPILRAWVHLAAMDFAGVVAICESMPTSFRLPTTNRQRYILTGSAEAAVGNHDRALEHLLRVKHDMNRQPTTDDWYFRMPLQSGLTELWLAKGDWAEARREAESFLEITLATAERTYQGLAWEANARAAMAAQDGTRAEECIAKALSTIEGFEVPLAAWRVHGTAAEHYARAGAHNLAGHQRELSRATILKLANSLPLEEPLRQIFLSAPMVRKILGRQRNYRLTLQRSLTRIRPPRPVRASSLGVEEV